MPFKPLPAKAAGLKRRMLCSSGGADIKSCWTCGDAYCSLISLKAKKKTKNNFDTLIALLPKPQNNNVPAPKGSKPERGFPLTCDLRK